MRLCAARRIAIVPQGGNSGLVGGQIPDASGTQLVISLERLRCLRSLDPSGTSLIAEAGMTLLNVQDAARDAGRLFPLSLASEGSAQIGGVLATNAGGVAVLRYGTARDLVLGLEVVTPSGEIWDGLNSLRKDNTGYDLKSLFVGSEGTLGIITAAALRLFPQPRSQSTVLAGVRDLDELAQLFRHLDDTAGPSLTAFEFLPRLGLELVAAHVGQVRMPFGLDMPWYALIEVSAHDGDEAATAIMTRALADAPYLGATAFADTLERRRDLWRLREGLSEAQRHAGGSIKHDVSVPVSALPPFITAATELVERLVPGARPLPFGHWGDGNVHFNVSQPMGGDRDAFLARWDEVTGAVHDLVHEFGGSFSAEHGIGQLKRGDLVRFKTPLELQMMRRIKAALDPAGIMNPGKLL